MLFLTLEKDEHGADPSQASSVPLAPPPPSPQFQARMVGEEEAAGGVPRVPACAPVEAVPPSAGMPTLLDTEEGRA